MRFFKSFPSSDVRHTRYYLINYNGSNFRILKNKYQLDSGWECIKSIVNTDKEEVERISISRTKARIRELALCNNFEYFGTMSSSSNYL